MIDLFCESCTIYVREPEFYDGDAHCPICYKRLAVPEDEEGYTFDE